MLSLENVCVWYGKTQVLWDVSMTVQSGEMVALMGPNGSGKSTVFKAVTGLLPVRSGKITWNGRDITNLPTHAMTSIGISLVLERRRLFPRMTVRENVLLGAYSERDASVIKSRLDEVEDLFPLVKERADAVAGSLSGGQQQMVAIARGLMSDPKMLIMDEPFLGLSPIMVKQITAVMVAVNKRGKSVLFNEQNARVSFGNSDRGYLLQSGQVVLSGSGLAMLDHEEVKSVYLGH
ncbi:MULTISPECIES: ABC transporter ATP-binding protein [unclassified Xanthobacter]|uniref:ABC transporter ATP-binding protein n=1 Tax=unclassified Xanthobacter TaxID=2623496 RepID=UPI001EDE6C0B|nr:MULTISPECIES: ABC transporter ATP-binding protein [unclassified Xanthobacter]